MAHYPEEEGQSLEMKGNVGITNWTYLLVRQGGDVTRFFNATDTGGAAEEIAGIQAESTCSLLKLQHAPCR